jgi:predicted kinase
LSYLFDKISNIILASINAIEENSAVTFDNKAFPSKGWAIFTAGGPGSGKSWVIKQQFLIDAKVIDSDDIKLFYIKWLRKILADPNVDAKTKADLLSHFGGKIPNPRNPEDMERLHYWTSHQKHFFTHMLKNFLRSSAKNLQNFILDTTGNNTQEIIDSAKIFKSLGYKVSLVWIITNIDIAKERNRNRERVVSEEYLIKTHNKIMNSIPKAITSGQLQYIDEFWLVFNNTNVSDSTVSFREKFKDTAFKLKKNGNSFELDHDLLMKIVKESGIEPDEDYFKKGGNI